MLLAEIHGKHAAAIEANEDYLTSAVFGHLRHVRQGELWIDFLQAAQSVDGSCVSLLRELKAVGLTLDPGGVPRILFWPRTTKYGEPDILLHFTTSSSRSLVLIIEVKLYAQKSSSGDDDQLRKYFDLLHDQEELRKLLGVNLGMPEVALIYLTERFAAAEVLESVRLSPHVNAGRRMFPLQWQDLTALIRKLNPPKDSEMGEVLRFLQHRNYDHFGGFRQLPELMVTPTIGFYAITYFARISEELRRIDAFMENFYGK